MPSFPKLPPLAYDPAAEIAALETYRDTKPGRAIPAKAANRLLLASWNIANLGLQKRLPRDYQLLAALIGWFDLIAVQEVNDNLSGLDAIMADLRAPTDGTDYRIVFSDKAGNNERMAFIYDAAKVTLLDMVGELGIPPTDHKHIKLPGVTRKFTGFDRNPYIAAFACGAFRFTLVNVHLYYGKDSDDDRDRRSLETYAVGRFADLRRDSGNAYTPHVIAVGDFNMPKAAHGDPIYKALVKRGLKLPKHTTKVGSTIYEDAEYDQIAFFPGLKQSRYLQSGVFDFDGGLLKALYDSTTPGKFRAYMRYYFSDHRILWAAFKSD